MLAIVRRTCLAGLSHCTLRCPKCFFCLNEGYLVGADAIEMIVRHAFSMCFIGANSISAQNGFMTYTDEDAQLKRADLARSGKRICLADHTKFNRSSFVKFAGMEQMDILITDTIDLGTWCQFSEAGLRVIAADEEIRR